MNTQKLNPKLKSTTFNQRLNHAYMVEDERACKKTHRRSLAAEGGDDGELQEIYLRCKEMKCSKNDLQGPFQVFCGPF